MSQLSAAQQQQVATLWANEHFVAPNAIAVFTTTDIIAAVQALDNAFDTTLNAAVTAVGGTLSIIQGLNAAIPAPFSSASVQAKTTLCTDVLMARAGLI
jgi:hypothetical protein